MNIASHHVLGKGEECGKKSSQKRSKLLPATLFKTIHCALMSLDRDKTLLIEKGETKVYNFNVMCNYFVICI